MPDPRPAHSPSPLVAGAVTSALVLTLLAGVAMRWAMAGVVPMVWDFGRLRHAHGHLGYYGWLVPMAWLGWSACGLPLPSRRAVGVYVVAVVLAIAGFLRAGYAPEAIVGSTIVGGVWLLTAWTTRERLRHPMDPLGGLLPGMVASLACVPFVARSTRVDPAVAQQWVATFLAALLLLVVVPTALGVLRVARPWPVLFGAGALGSAALGVWPTPVARMGLVVFAGMLLPVRWGEVPLHVKVVWAAVSVGVAGMAMGWLPNTRPVVLGAIHFVALSAAAPALATTLGWRLGAAGWWVHHAAVGLLCGPLVLQAFGAGAWTWSASALGGTMVLLEALGALGWQARSRLLADSET